MSDKLIEKQTKFKNIFNDSKKAKNIEKEYDFLEQLSQTEISCVFKA